MKQTIEKEKTKMKKKKRKKYSNIFFLFFSFLFSSLANALLNKANFVSQQNFQRIKKKKKKQRLKQKKRRKQDFQNCRFQHTFVAMQIARVMLTTLLFCFNVFLFCFVQFFFFFLFKFLSNRKKFCFKMLYATREEKKRKVEK